MSTLAKSDIFFFIATIGFSLVTILLCVVLVYGILIAKKFYDVSKLVKATAQDIVEKINDVQNYIEESPVLHFIQSFVGRRKKSGDAKESTVSSRSKKNY